MPAAELQPICQAAVCSQVFMSVCIEVGSLDLAAIAAAALGPVIEMGYPPVRTALVLL